MERLLPDRGLWPAPSLEILMEILIDSHIPTFKRVMHVDVQNVDACLYLTKHQILQNKWPDHGGNPIKKGAVPKHAPNHV